MARTIAVLLIVAATIICIAPDYDLDPTVLCSTCQNAVASATACLLTRNVALVTTPVIRIISRAYAGGWLPSFTTVLDLDCARLC